MVWKPSFQIACHRVSEMQVSNSPKGIFSIYHHSKSFISILKYIRPITKYLDIKDLPINGKFVDIYGNLHDRIAGIIYSEYDKGQSF